MRLGRLRSRAAKPPEANSKMAYPEQLASRVRGIAKTRPTVTEKKMFGGLAFMLNGYMFCGVSQDFLMARVGLDRYSASLAKPHGCVIAFTASP